MVTVHTNEEAMGIPSRHNFGSPTTELTPGQLYNYVVQKHQAERAGLHRDLRIGDAELGLLSWALRKGLPQPGQKHLAVQQPLHSHNYLKFRGAITSGYGKGTVSREDLGQVLVTKVTPDAVHFSTAHRRFPERYVLVRPKTGRNWLMLNTTKTEAVPYEKLHFKLVPQDQAETVLNNMQPGSSAQSKIDGAAALVQLYRDHFEVMSYRTQKETGWPIVHTERVTPARHEIKVPREHQGEVLRGELYGTREGKPIPPHELGGLLNASISKSLHDQEQRNIKMKVMLYGMLNKQTGKEDLNVPYEQRLAKTKEIGSVLPRDVFHYPTEAKTPEEAKGLLQRISTGQEPSTVEGMVVHPPTGMPQKIKLRDEHDVYIREFFPGMGKYQGRGVGGFRYSHEPTGPIVGEVGTGFSDEERQNMHTNPQDYLGRVAKVTAQNKKPSGALFAPSYMALHEDYPTKTAETVLDERPSVLDSYRLRRIKDNYDLNDYVKEAASALKGLLKAKERSDVGDYRAKTHEMRELLRTKPHEFEVDSDQGHTVGLTHKPTKFKVHLPKTALPTEFTARKRA